MSKFIYPYPSNIDLSEHKSENPKISFYGLPKDVKFCRTCVISNQRPSSDYEHKNTGKGRKKTSLRGKCSFAWLFYSLLPELEVGCASFDMLAVSNQWAVR